MTRAHAETGLVVSNVYSDTNRGGALLTHACVGALRRIAPHAAIALVPTSLGQTRDDFSFVMENYEGISLAPGLPLRLGDQRFRNALVAETLAALSRSRRSGVPRAIRGEGYDLVGSAALVVGKGGQLFRDYSSRAGLRSFALASSSLVAASAESVPTALYGVQIGPYRNRGAQKAAAAVLKRLDVVLARDEVSAQIARDLGAHNVHQVPDTVFGVDVASFMGVGERAGESYDVLVVADSIVRSLGPEGVASLIDTMTSRVRSGVADYTVVTAQSGANGGADYIAARAVAERCALVAPCRFLGPTGVSELLDLYGRANLVVTCRVHGGIMALLVRTPALVLCPSSTKALDLFRSVGFAEVAVGPNTSEELIAVLRERLEAIETDMAFSAEEIAARVDQLRGQVRAADRELMSLVG